MNKRTTALVFAMLCGASQMALAAAAAVTPATISNLRFIDTDRNVTAIASGVELPGLTSGDLVGELEFQSDQYDPVLGVYSYSRLAVFWKLEGAGGFAHFSNVDQPGWEWLGQSKFVSPEISFFDESTGVGTATFILPIGRGLKENGGLSAATDYPHVPEDAELTVAVGWRSALAIDSAGALEGDLVTAVHQLESTWPDVYVASGDFVTELPVMTEPRTIKLALRAPAVAPRTFTVSADPSYRVSLTNPQVTVPAGESIVDVPFVPQSVGAVRFLVTESGVQVAESDSFRVEQLVRAKELDTGTTWLLGGPSGPQQDAEETPLFEEGKLCVEGSTPYGPQRPLHVTCSKCDPDPANSLVCSGEPAPETEPGPMTFYSPTACVGDPGVCYWSLTPPYELSTYRFSSKLTMIKCKTITLNAGIQLAPFGIGGTVGTSTEIPAWRICCVYAYDPTTPSGESTNGRTCN